MVVHQDAIGGLMPGGRVGLHGTITNPGAPGMVGEVKVTGIFYGDGSDASADYAVTGIALFNSNVATGGAVEWGKDLPIFLDPAPTGLDDGLTLNYLNTFANQDRGKGATVTIHYTTTAYVPAIKAYAVDVSAGDWGTCANGNPAQAPWATDTMDKFYQLKKTATGYNRISANGETTFDHGTITLTNDPKINQVACQGATVTLAYALK